MRFVFWFLFLRWFFRVTLRAQNDPVETLFVSIEADTSKLLKQTKTGVDQAEGRLKKFSNRVGAQLQNTFKKVGDTIQTIAPKAASFAKRAGSSFAKFGKGVINNLGKVQAAFTVFFAFVATGFKLATEAISGLRIERGFRRLAAAAGQSSDEILKAMRRASAGTVSNLDLMREANLAMSLGVASTPAQFEALTEAAIKLGAAIGRGPVESINDLISAAGRGSTAVLDNLGLSITDVRTEMDKLAQERFGRLSDELDDVNKKALFMEATIKVAAVESEKLGDNIKDAGTPFDRLTADGENFKQEIGETSIIFFTLLNEMFEGETIMARLVEGAKAWQFILISIGALIGAINDALKESVEVTKKQEKRAFELAADVARTGEQDVEIIAKSVAETFNESFRRRLDELNQKFKGIIDPEGAAAGAEGLALPTDQLEESADEAESIIQDLGLELAELQRTTDESLEELAEDHQERMVDIEEKGADARARIVRDLAKELTQLAAETEAERASIIEDAAKELSELSGDTDRELSDKRNDFNKGERRDTENHLKEMRRLQENFLFDLDDAVRARDARAVVDLQRRFAQESGRREEDFSTQQNRGQEDQSAELTRIRENENRRRQEITAAKAEQLQDLINDEAAQRAAIEASAEEQRVRLEERLAQQRERENENFAERQEELQAALQTRLEAIARELASEDEVTEAGARRILDTLNRFFGAGGDIDQLMAEFASRQQLQMQLDVSFNRPSGGGQSGRAGRAQRGRGGRSLPIIGMAEGGTIVANQPTVALFGEAGPEVAQFTPLNSNGGGAGPQEIKVTFGGSAPPGIGSGERDQIASVVLDALNQSGVMTP